MTEPGSPLPRPSVPRELFDRDPAARLSALSSVLAKMPSTSDRFGRLTYLAYVLATHTGEDKDDRIKLAWRKLELVDADMARDLAAALEER